MSITIRCPNPACGKTAAAADGVAGRGVKCPRCGTQFVAGKTVDGRGADTARAPALPAADPFPALPAEFGRYRVTKLLGRGGMGAVYLAQDTQLGRTVALKLPAVGPGESPTRAERFVREARAAAALHHPNICTVFDAGEVGGRPFLSMAYVEGKPLDEAVDPAAPMPEREAVEVARKVAAALAHAHSKGVVHRDLKPANVMLTAAGEPVVMDFGLAKRVAEADPNEAKLTRDGAVMGTPTYMAPEQVKGEQDKVGPATDVYALGVVLFELLTGRPPYQGPVGMVMGQILVAPVPPAAEFRPGCDPLLDAMCRKAMAKDPADRFKSMAAFADALAGYLAPSPAEPPPVAAPVAAAPVTPSKVTKLAARPAAAPASARRHRPEAVEPAPRRPRWAVPAVAAGVAAVGLVGTWAAGGLGGAGRKAEPDPGGRAQAAAQPAAQVPRSTAPDRPAPLGAADKVFGLAEIRRGGDPAAGRGGWAAAGGVLRQDEVDDGDRPPTLAFGDPGWLSYDLSAKVKVTTVGQGVWVLFHYRDPKNWCGVKLGSYSNWGHELGHLANDGWVRGPDMTRHGAVEPDTWYKVDLAVRGTRCECRVDGDTWFDWRDLPADRGRVGFRTAASACRFKDVTVTAPGGQVLWTGPPPLP